MPTQTIPLRPPDVAATGTLTAAQATLATATTATSSIALALGGGQGSWDLYVGGTITTSTVVFDGTLDPNPATTAWFQITGTQFGSPANGPVTSFTLASAAVAFHGGASGLAQVRARLSNLATGDSLSVTLRASGASSTVIKAVSPPLALSRPSSSTTTAASDNTIALGSTMAGYYIQNNSGATIYVNEDLAATLGSTAVLNGSYVSRSGIQVTNLHIYTTTAVSVNGTTAGGIVVQGIH